jgi:hypothetical protein
VAPRAALDPLSSFAQASQVTKGRLAGNYTQSAYTTPDDKRSTIAPMLTQRSFQQHPLTVKHQKVVSHDCTKDVVLKDRSTLGLL